MSSREEVGNIIAGKMSGVQSVMVRVQILIPLFHDMVDSLLFVAANKGGISVICFFSYSTHSVPQVYLHRALAFFASRNRNPRQPDFHCKIPHPLLRIFLPSSCCQVIVLTRRLNPIFIRRGFSIRLSHASFFASSLTLGYNVQRKLA